jgi:hypothetical protein
MLTVSTWIPFFAIRMESSFPAVNVYYIGFG